MAGVLVDSLVGIFLLVSPTDNGGQLVRVGMQLMQEFLERDMAYVIRLDEMLWGSLLLAITLVIHAVGMFRTHTATTRLIERTKQYRSAFVSIGILILATLMIVLVSFFEVMVWAGFFVWSGAQPKISSAFYNAILNYTTLQAGYLPLRWRLLEGMLGMAGLLAFAWSTGIMMSLVQQFTQEQLERRKGHQIKSSEPHGN